MAIITCACIYSSYKIKRKKTRITTYKGLINMQKNPSSEKTPLVIPKNVTYNP